MASSIGPFRDQPVLIAADHAGIALKTALIAALPSWKWLDLGANLGPDGKPPRVDYPDFSAKLAEQLLAGKAPQGVLICGSGLGVAIAANKFHGIRAVTVENPVAARLSREHNHANVLCLGARFVAAEYAAEIVEAFLNTGYSTEGRHQARVDKITALEKISDRPAKGRTPYANSSFPARLENL